MAFTYLGPDPLEVQIERVLQHLARGALPRAIERKNVDIKEEPGRRGQHGQLLKGQPHNEHAAAYLAHEMACLANTPGGGAVVLGVADDGERIGTELEPEWLRHRIYELSNQRLTVDVRVGRLDETRILILRAPEALEPIRSRQRVYWRVSSNCVEIDAATWSEGRLHRAGYDWSAQPSGHTFKEARPAAIEAARRYLRQAGDISSLDLADATDEDLLRRLNVMTPEDVLTNAGSLLFVSTKEPGIDYIRRDHPGGDSTIRIVADGPLLTQILETETAAAAGNATVHVSNGWARGQIRTLPSSAIREAIVNGVVHRDWMSPAPTVVEHVAKSLTVTSPGGFVGGVSPSNIITHPSVPRYRSLSNVVSDLRLSEQEGIGFDRMVADMLALGYSQPHIHEIPGPYVRVALIGESPDLAWIALLSQSEPKTLPRDVDQLLLLDELRNSGWIDVVKAAPVVQRSVAETRGAIQRLLETKHQGEPLVVPVDGVPGSDEPAWKLSESAQSLIRNRIAWQFEPRGRLRIILGWVAARGRISSAEVSSLTGVVQSHANTILKRLENDGVLEASRSNRRGRGFYYIAVHNDR